MFAVPPTKDKSKANAKTKRKNPATTKSNKSTATATTDDEVLVWGIPRQTVLIPLIVLLLSQFLLFIGVGAVIPSIPLYGKEIGLSSASNGIVISAPAVALLLLANVSGKYADQARKPAMMAGMALIVVSDIGTALATSLPTLMLARLGLGAGRGVSEAGERGLLADLASQVPALRGRALAAQQAVVALGIAIGAPFGGYIVEEYGPRAAFLCVSAAASVALILYALLPETVGKFDIDDDNKQEASDKNDNKKPNNKIVEWTTLLQDNSWRGLALCQSGASFGFAAKIASIPILATATLPGGALGAGALLSAAGLSGLIGAPLGGWITDRAGAQVAAIGSGIIAGVALAGIPLALSLSTSPAVSLPVFQNVDMGFNGIAFVGLVILWSTAVAAQGPAMTALAQEWAPTGSKATSMALPQAARDGTYIVAPFILGVVADKALGVPGAECAVAGFAAVLGTLALALLGERNSG